MARIFIGSAGRMIGLVHEIAACLRSAGHEPLPWTEIFEHGDITIDRLIALAREVHGAILVFSGDDKLESGYHQPRPNVLIEFGLFAGQLGRKKAIVCRFGDHRFPSDLGGLTYLDLGDNPEQLDRATQSKLCGWAESLARETEPIASEVGITQIYSSFPLAEFRRELHTAKVVHILQTFIPYSQHLHHFESDLLEAIQRGCEVQILLLDPWSNVVELRQQSLHPGYRKDGVRQEILSNLEQLAMLNARLPRDRCDRLAVRVHATMPSMSIYRIDDRFFSGHYFHGNLAIDSPQLKISSLQSSMGRRLTNEHRQLWTAATTRTVDLFDVNGWMSGGAP